MVGKMNDVTSQRLICILFIRRVLCILFFQSIEIYGIHKFPIDWLLNIKLNVLTANYY